MCFKRAALVLIILLFVSVNGASAVCSGVYFKTNKVQHLSIPLNLGGPYTDIDGDGINDLIGISYDLVSPGAYVVFYKGSVNGLDTPPVTSFIGSSFPSTMRFFVDVNNDGKKDMISRNETTPTTATVYLNNGSGSFTASATSILGMQSEYITDAGDLNSDGKADILTSPNEGNNGVYYRLMQNDGTFGAAVLLNSNAMNGQMADFNGDGINDVSYFIKNQIGTPVTVQDILNQGNAIFSGGGSAPLDNFGVPQVTGDVNGDNKPDLVSGIYADPFLNSNKIFTVFLNNGSGGLTKVNVDVTSLSPSSYYSRTQVADFDGDGLIDLMFVGSDNYLFAKNNGSMSYTVQKFQPSNVSSNNIKDLNSDLKADLVQSISSWLTNRVDGIRFLYNVCDRPGQTKYVDRDANGYGEIGFWRPSDGHWQFYNGPADIYWGSGAQGDIPVPQDYDGDGITDIAVFRESTGVWYIANSSSGVMIAQFGAPGDKPVPSDFDGDGKADLVVYRPSAGNWYAYQSQSGTVFAANFGLNGDIPLPMDYDGDFKADLAVFRPSNGTWYFFKTADQGYYVVNFGLNGDRPVPADYDNDTRADIALYRNGYWYIYTARNEFYVHQWGTAGDIPFPYADGPYRTVMGVYRPGNEAVYLYQSSSFFFTGHSGEKIVSWILPAN